MSETILELKNIHKAYTAPDGNAVQVLNGVSLSIERGDSIAVVGPSGSGKSTLLNIAGTLDRPDAGEVILEGRPLGAAGDRELSRIRNRNIGFVFQLHHLLPQCTLLENILLPTVPFSNRREEELTGSRARELLSETGLSERSQYFPGQLSGGELQRGAVVRALINGPGLLLADEPTGSLDRKASEKVMEILLRLKDREKTSLVVVTHSKTIAEKMDRICFLENGALTSE